MTSKVRIAGESSSSPDGSYPESPTRSPALGPSPLAHLPSHCEICPQAVVVGGAVREAGEEEGAVGRPGQGMPRGNHLLPEFCDGVEERGGKG